MAKLIFDKGVVEERNDLKPITGFWRVVYEEDRFKHLLDEEEPFPNEKRGIVKAVVSKAFASEPTYVVYAVSKEKYLPLEFSKRVSHQNHKNHFDLNFKIAYHVSYPKVLVERLRAGKEDPLVRLRDTVGEGIGGACASVAWEIIKDERAFSEVAEDLTSPRAAVFTKINDMAQHLGLEVSEIKFSLRLLEKDLQDWKEDLEHERILARKLREKEIAKADEEIQHVKTMHASQREVLKGGTEAIVKSLENIAEDTNTAVKLRNNIETLGSIFFPQVNAPGSDVASLPAGSQKLLAEKASALPGEGLSLLQQIISVIAQLDLREKEKKHLLAAVFHLAGELLAADEAHPEALEHYRERYRTILDQFMPEMEDQQVNMLESLVKAERL